MGRRRHRAVTTARGVRRWSSPGLSLPGIGRGDGLRLRGRRRIGMASAVGTSAACLPGAGDAVEPRYAPLATDLKPQTIALKPLGDGVGAGAGAVVRVPVFAGRNRRGRGRTSHGLINVRLFESVGEVLGHLAAVLADLLQVFVGARLGSPLGEQAVVFGHVAATRRLLGQTVVAARLVLGRLATAQQAGNQAGIDEGSRHGLRSVDARRGRIFVRTGLHPMRKRKNSADRYLRRLSMVYRMTAGTNQRFSRTMTASTAGQTTNGGKSSRARGSAQVSASASVMPAPQSHGQRHRGNAVTPGYERV